MQMKKNHPIKKYPFLWLLRAELRFSLTLGKITALILAAVIGGGLISFLPIIISGLSEGISGAKNKIGGAQVQEFYLFILFTNAVAIFIILKTTTNVKNRATVDKNRATFIYYNKHQVALAKLIVQVLPLVIGFVSIFTTADILAWWRWRNFNFRYFSLAVLSIFPGYLVIYLLIYIVSKWAINCIPKQGLAYAIAIMIAVVLMMPLYIFNRIPQVTILRFSLSLSPTSIESWFARHQNVAVWLPFFNIGLINGFYVEALVTYAGCEHKYPLLEHNWYVLVPICYCGIAMASIWNLQVSAQKKYLAVS